MANNKIKLENSHRSWKTFKNFNQRRAWKKSKINKRRAYVYSGL